MRPVISDDMLADWHARWPSTLPTSVPHEQVRMLIEDLRAAREELEDTKRFEMECRTAEKRAKAKVADLLAACKTLDAAVTSGIYSRSAIDAARSAIAKAEGR